jgi:hypothetical protein
VCAVCPGFAASAVQVGNGTMSCGVTSVGGICSGTCNSGFSGTPTAKCGDDGKWGAVVGTCQQSECQQPCDMKQMHAPTVRVHAKVAISAGKISIVCM